MSEKGSVPSPLAVILQLLFLSWEEWRNVRRLWKPPRLYGTGQSKLKVAFPESKFGVVVYYPFIDEHINIMNRLHSSNIDGVIFASESSESIENAVRLLLSTLQEHTL